MIEFSHRLEDIKSELEYPSNAETHTISFDFLSTLKHSSENCVAFSFFLPLILWSLEDLQQ